MIEDFGVQAAESTDEFWKAFNANVSSVRLHLGEAAKSVEAKDLLTTLKARIGQLQTYATESTNALPAYDVRRSQEILDALASEVKAVEAQVQPKKKFAFSSKPKASAVTLAPPSTAAVASTVPEQPAVSAESKAVLPPDSFVISHRQGEELSFTYEQIVALLPQTSSANPHIQLHIQRCSDCVICVPLLLGSVRIEHIARCTLLLGPCLTSVYIEGAVDDCVLAVACHQLRVHNTHDSALLLTCKSHPIIEDCVGLRCGPYTAQYPSLPQQLHEASLNTAPTDNHTKVVDFRWHKATPSPNWRALTADEMQQSTARLQTVLEKVT
eukprot:gene35090-42499_t